MSDPGCDHYQSLIPELALGVLDGRERDDALAHLEHCAACQRELASMSDIADRMVALTPSAEPPAGFETRVLAALPTPPSAVRRTSRPRRVLTFAVAAAVAAGIGIGGWAVGHGTTHPYPSASGAVRTAALVELGHPAGRVVAYGGTRPWVAMDVQSDLGDRTVRCQVVALDGRTTTVGIFTLAGGDGYWAAATGVSPASVSGLRLVDGRGTVLAAAVFTHQKAGPAD